MNRDLQLSTAQPLILSDGSFQFLAEDIDGNPINLLCAGGITPGNSYSYPDRPPVIRISDGSSGYWEYSLGVALALSPVPVLTVSSITNDLVTGQAQATYVLQDHGLDLEIIQRVSIVSGGQNYQIDFEVINHGTASVTYDFTYHVDPENDHGANLQPFTVNGRDIVSNTTFGGSGSLKNSNPVPVFFDLATPDLDIVVSVAGYPNAPDRLKIGHYDSVSTYMSGRFDNLNSTSPFANHSAYAVIWDNRTVAAGGTSGPMTTYFGLTPFVGGGGGEAKVVMFNMNPDSGFVGVDLLTPENALRARNNIRTAVSEVAIMRGSIGAGMNRLQAAINVLAVTSMNTLAAESSIRDANIAEEITNMTKFQILAQTGIAALSQANANARSVLSLLI